MFIIMFIVALAIFIAFFDAFEKALDVFLWFLVAALLLGAIGC
jgi:hypothetical protein